MDTRVFISKPDLLRKAERRGIKNVATMRKAEIAGKLGVTIAPRPKLSPDEKRIRSRAYQRKHYWKKKKKKTARPPQRRSPTGAYVHTILMYVIVLLLFMVNNAMMSF